MPDEFDPSLANITVLWDLKVASKVTRIRWTAYSNKDYASPDYTLEASNNGTSWVTAFVSTPTPTLNGKWNTFDATSITSTPYRYWRLSHKDQAAQQGAYARIGDFRLYNGTHEYGNDEIIIDMLGRAINAGAIGGTPAVTFNRTVNPTGLASVFVAGSHTLASAMSLGMTGLASAFAAGSHTLNATKNITVASVNDGAMGSNPSLMGAISVAAIEAGIMGVMPALSQTSTFVNTRRRGRTVAII